MRERRESLSIPNTVRQAEGREELQVLLQNCFSAPSPCQREGDPSSSQHDSRTHPEASSQQAGDSRRTDPAMSLPVQLRDLRSLQEETSICFRL